MTPASQPAADSQEQRQIVSMLVAWCLSCEVWLPEKEIGGLCFFADCLRKLVRRRRWVCQTKDYGCSFATKSEALAHGCEDECF